MKKITNSFIRNNVVVPYNCTTKSLTFSIREYSNAVSYKATLYINNIASSLIAEIVDGSINYTITSNTSVALNALDLISIKLDFTGGALSNGVTLCLLLSK